MSTRTQIEFKHITKYADKKKPVIERRTIYRHSDGYPEGVIPDLKEFLKWNSGRNNDIEYQAANFIYWSKRMFEEKYFNKDCIWSDCIDTSCSGLHTGFGVCENDGFHGDIEYFYEVVRETTEKTKGEYETKTKIFVYKVEQKDFNKPVTRKNFRLLSEETIKEAKK